MKNNQNFISFFRKNLLIIILIIIFISIRLININQEEYWFDEYITQLIIQKLSPKEIINYVAYNQHPPLYYFILFPWVKLFGIQEIYGRLPSLFFAFLGYILTYKIIKVITNNKLVLYCCLLLLTFSSLNIEYSQEARSYTLVLFEFLLIIYLLLVSLKQKNITTPKLIMISVIGSSMLYTHYLQIPTLGGILLSLLILKYFYNNLSSLINRLIITILISFLSFIPWINLLIKATFLTGIYQSTIEQYKNLTLFISSTIYFSYLDINFNLYFLSLLLIVFIVYISIKKVAKIKKNPLIFFILLNLVFGSISIYLSPISHIYTYTWQRHLINIQILFFIYICLFCFQIFKKLTIIFIFIFLISIASTPRILQNDSTWFYHHQYRNITKYINDYEKKADLILIPYIRYEIMVQRYYKGHNTISNILLESTLNKSLPKLQIYKIISNKISKQALYNLNLEFISQNYKRIWLVNNYSEEDKYALNYFKKNNWQMKSIDDFANQRLWLIGKNINK